MSADIYFRYGSVHQSFRSNQRPILFHQWPEKLHQQLSSTSSSATDLR